MPLAALLDKPTPLLDDPLDEIDIAIARSSPAGLAWVADGRNQTGNPEQGWLPFPHLELLSDVLMRVAAGQVKRLIVTMPPRHGKSQLISQFGPAWYLGTYPRRKVMLASNTVDLAGDLSRLARDTLREFGPEIFGVHVRGDSSSVKRWQTAQGGIMVAAGVGGTLTGRGAHLLIIDDPIKNDEEAASDLIREKQWNWWQGTARTRLQTGASVIVVQTRWHEDDLAGRMLQLADDNAKADQWEILNLPAIAEEDPDTDEPYDDALGRKLGEALCPPLMSLPELETTKETLSTYHWYSLYQQTPRPAEGLLFKSNDFRFFDVQPPSEQWPKGLYLLEGEGGALHPVDVAACAHFQTADTAASEKEMADYTVVSTWAVTPVERYLLLVHVERGKFEDTRVGAMLRSEFDRHKPGFVSVENAGPSGPKVIKQLLGEGLPIRSANPDVDKVTRSLPAVALYEAHRVYHRRAAGWRKTFEHELLGFPNVKNDDQVDTVSYAAIELPRVQFASRRQKGGRGTELGGLASKQL